MTTNMRKGWSITKLAYKVGIVYRLHYFVSLFSVPVNVLIYYFLWKAIFTYSGETIIRGYTLPEIVTYYVIAMLVGFITYSEVDEWMEFEVVHGKLVSVLMNPIGYFAWMAYQTIGMNLFGIIVEIIPIMIIGLLIGLQAPSLMYLGFFIISVAIAAALYHLFAYMTGLAAFWLKRIRGIRRSRRVIIAFLSGSLIPLTFFPAGVQKAFMYLPFSNMRFSPVQIYLGKFTITQTLISLLVGIVWIVILYQFTKIIWKKAFKKFSGAGV